MFPHFHEIIHNLDIFQKWDKMSKTEETNQKRVNFSSILVLIHAWLFSHFMQHFLIRLICNIPGVPSRLMVKWYWYSTELPTMENLALWLPKWFLPTKLIIDHLNGLLLCYMQKGIFRFNQWAVHYEVQVSHRVDHDAHHGLRVDQPTFMWMINFGIVHKCDTCRITFIDGKDYIE